MILVVDRLPAVPLSVHRKRALCFIYIGERFVFLYSPIRIYDGRFSACVCAFMCDSVLQ